jgi:type II secretory pathway component PulF
MSTFTYNAINEAGQVVRGEIEADSSNAVGEIISARGLILTKVKEKTAGQSAISFSWLMEKLTPVSAPELILFTKQFKTMVKAGLSMIRLLSILQEQTENVRLKSVLKKMEQDISEGSSLFDAFRRHKNVFSPLYISMVRAGETSGALTDVFERLIYLIEHEHKIKSDIKSALTYPIIVVLFLGIAFFVLLNFVVPKFVGIFSKAGLELPLPTKICLLLHDFLANYWGWILLGLTLFIVVVGYFLRTEPGRFVRDSILMRLPIIGPLFVKSAMSRFASIFAILQASGIAVLDAMDILSFTIANAAVSRQFDSIKNKLQEGRGISGPLSQSKYFTPMIINMVAVGEESGNLDEMLSEAAGHYDVEVEYAVAQLSQAIGPVLVVGLAVVVGFFALSIFLPMWDMVQTA